MNQKLKKLKRKAHRKKLREAEESARRKKQDTIDQWIKDWRESRADYPVTKSKKKLTWKDYQKLIKR